MSVREANNLVEAISIQHSDLQNARQIAINERDEMRELKQKLEQKVEVLTANKTELQQSITNMRILREEEIAKNADLRKRLDEALAKIEELKGFPEVKKRQLESIAEQKKKRAEELEKLEKERLAIEAELNK